jgi:Holliday junction resolvase RusA-like endonuclease
MSALSFTVPGPPRGKGRPRATIRGAHAAVYTDAKTASYENLVALAGMAALGALPPFDCPLVVQLLIRVTPAKSATRKALAAMLGGDQPPAKRPDIDNVAKAVTDGLNARVYVDDAQIVRLVVEKVYAATSGVDVTISPYVNERAA